MEKQFIVVGGEKEKEKEIQSQDDFFYHERGNYVLMASCTSNREETRKKYK